MTQPAPLFASLAETESTSDATDERILDAAVHQLSRFGMRRLTIDDVAKQARVGRATIYRRYGTKNRLIAATLMREAARMGAEVDGAISRAASPEDQLVEGFVTAIRTGRENRLFMQLLEIEPEMALPYVTTNAAPLIALARDVQVTRIRELQEQGRLGAMEPDIVAEIIIRLAQSLVLTPEGAIPTDDDGLREFARTYLVRLLLP